MSILKATWSTKLSHRKELPAARGEKSDVTTTCFVVELSYATQKDLEQLGWQFETVNTLPQVCGRKFKALTAAQFEKQARPR